MYKKYASGYTLPELMTTLVVSGIVLNVGAPALGEFVAANHMTAATNDITSAMHVARTEAVKRRANVTLCASSNYSSNAPTCNAAADFADGWIVFVDCTVVPPPAGTCGAPNFIVENFDTVVGSHGPFQADIRNNFVTNPGTPQYVAYSPTGFPRTIAGLPQPKTDFQLCDARGDKNVGGGIAAGRWIRITPTGRPQIYHEVVDLQGPLNPLGGC